MNDTWDKVMSFKDKDDMWAWNIQGQPDEGTHNTLDDDDINTICGTIDFFSGNYRQDIFDLKVAKYPVFDWLAMRVQGRHSGSEADKEATKVLAYSFIKSGGVPSKFIEDLRVTDYDIDHSYEAIELAD